MRELFSVLVITLMLAEIELVAQPAAPPGAPVRISAPTLDLHDREGFLDPDSVLIIDRGYRLAVPLCAVTKLHVYRGRKSSPIRGALIGLAIGAGGGAIMGAIAEASGERFCLFTCSAAGTLTAMSATLLGVQGVVIGTVAGALHKTDRWEKVPLDRLRVSIAPNRVGFALGLSVSF